MEKRWRKQKREARAKQKADGQRKSDRCESVLHYSAASVTTNYIVR